MKISENLRARAAHIGKHGFSPYRWCGNHACCFVGAEDYVRDDCHNNEAATEFLRRAIFHKQRYPFAAGKLNVDGWNTDDAVAALNIAADIAECDGL